MKKLLLLVLMVCISLFWFASGSFAQSKAVPDGTPQRGGTLRIINPMSPRALGYYPDMGPYDSVNAYPAVERLMEPSNTRNLWEPFLAESVQVDPKRPRMTFKLRKGVKFHDGTEMDAEVVAWNFRMQIEAKKTPYADKIKSIETPDKYTVVLNLTEYHNQLPNSYGWTPIFSKAAFDKNGADWCKSHPVGTGPFKIVEWKRDVSVKYERFTDYWQKGRPYLDGVEFIFIPDGMTATNIFQAKEADMWINIPVKDQADLVKKGFKRQSFWPCLPSAIYFNNVNTNAPTIKLKVREAVEYALDKAVITKALGFGFSTPLKMVAPEGSWGYDPKYTGRSYDPGKAKKLLAEAGYPNGLKLKLLCLSQGGRNVAAETIKAYLDQAGFNVEIDLADPGRFFASVYGGNGWDDMVLHSYAIGVNFLSAIEDTWGHSPKTNLGSLKMSPGFLEISKKAITYTKEKDQQTATMKMVKMIADEALVIPLWDNPSGDLVQNWVHTDRGRQALLRWKLYEAWMDKH